MKERLQLYEDGTYGYLFYDGDMCESYEGSRVVCTQGEDESREDFIKNNNIELIPNHFGYNEKLDMCIMDEDEYVRAEAAKVGYAVDVLLNDGHLVLSYLLDYAVKNKDESILEKLSKVKDKEISYEAQLYIEYKGKKPPTQLLDRWQLKKQLDPNNNRDVKEAERNGQYLTLYNPVYKYVDKYGIFKYSSQRI